jgi:hypothetical protein
VFLARLDAGDIVVKLLDFGIAEDCLGARHAVDAMAGCLTK